jgi:molybdopterin synthase catalytic subunit
MITASLYRHANVTTSERNCGPGHGQSYILSAHPDTGMKILGIVGPGAAAVTERLVARLSEHGTVATLEQTDEVTRGDGSGRYREAGAVQTGEVTDDGAWVVGGTGETLTDTLERLAPDVDYALVTGYPEADIRTVALAGRDHEGETVAAPADADDVDIQAVVDSLDEQEPFETLESLVARAKESEDSEYAGAIATFTGRVREKEGPDDERTEYLEFEQYDEVATEKMAAIREQLEAREGVYEVLLHHRTGVVHCEVDIVFVVVLAGHRAEAFETVEDGINRLKEEVPLFKKEVTVDGEFWAHEPDPN